MDEGEFARVTFAGWLDRLDSTLLDDVLFLRCAYTSQIRVGPSF